MENNFKQINLYAPVDCEVKGIEKSSDNVFVEKMLGDGIVIIPLANEFFLPFEKATCKLLFETGHAYGFEINDEISALIHCGLDTVKLNGKPFKTKVELNQNLKLNDPIFDVDLSELKKNNISSETPIVFDQVNIEKFEIINLVEKKYKKGELICSIKYKIHETEIVNNSNNLEEFKSKYQLTADEFIKAVGGPSNFSKVYNCLTRLRFNINDSSKVDEKTIKKNQLVKGINWNGNELQIIIGGEVYKIREEIDKKLKYLADKKETVEESNKSVLDKVMAAIAGIMIPSIPVLMTVGLFGALFAITTQLGWTVNIDSDTSGNYKTLADVDLFSALMYIFQKSGLSFIGLFFCINTVRYFGGNDILGGLVAVILLSRFFLAIPSGDTSNIEFGNYIINGNYGISGWFLFEIGDYPICIKGYEGSVLPFIMAGFLTVIVDKWIKTWMPSSIDVVFRSTLVVFLTVVPVLFIFGPFLSLIEYGMVSFVGLIEKIPFGLSVAIFSLMWQPLVLTGVHIAVGMTLMIPLFDPNTAATSLMMPAFQVAAMGQLGVCIGIAIFTKNSNLKSLAIGSIPAGIFGITEPMMYGVNLPKIKPFLLGCLAAFIGGFLSGILNIRQDIVGPSGILSLLNFNSTRNKLLTILVFIVTLISGILLTFIFFKERKNEYKYASSISLKIKKIIKRNNLDKVATFEIENEKILENFKNSKKIYSDYEKYIQQLTIVETKISNLISKEEKNKNKLYKKAKNEEQKKVKNEIQLKKYIEEFNSYNLQDKIAVQTKEKENLIKNNELVVSNYLNKVKELENNVSNFVNFVSELIQKKEILLYENDYWNAINAIEIGYGFSEAKINNISKEQKLILLN